MNRKNLFLILALLLGANQASAGWMDNVKSGFQNAGAWVISKFPESWQGRACVALGVCTLVAARYMMTQSLPTEDAAGKTFAIEVKKKEYHYDDSKCSSEVTKFIDKTIKPIESLAIKDFRGEAQSFRKNSTATDVQLVGAYYYLKQNRKDDKARYMRQIWIDRKLGK